MDGERKSVPVQQGTRRPREADVGDNKVVEPSSKRQEVSQSSSSASESMPECPVCTAGLFEPKKMVPCGHSYCAKCAFKLVFPHVIGERKMSVYLADPSREDHRFPSEPYEVCIVCILVCRLC
jgi:RING-type zinc-finger